MNFFKLETFDLPKTTAVDRFRKRVGLILAIAVLVVVAVLLVIYLR